MKYIIFLFTIASVQFVHAHGKSHREHKAHSHGVGQMGIAFEGAKGEIDFDIPGESVIGFEHKATKKADIKKTEDAIRLLTTKISEMVVFDAALKCVITPNDIKIVHEGQHSEVEARFSVQCEKTPASTDITFNFQKVFKRIKKVEVQVVADTLQKAATIQNDGAKITLKQ